MTMRRNEFCNAAALFLAAAAMPALAQVQEFPQRKPLRLIVGSPVASATDLVGRLLADGIETSLGQRVIVENKPTANGAIAGADVARSSADGYTLMLMATSSMVINPHLNHSVRWDPVKDFTAIVEIGTTASVVAVTAASPFRSFGDALAAAKARPGIVKLGVLAMTLSHFMALALKEEIGVEFALIPFTSQSQMMSAAISGDVDLISTGVGGIIQFFADGRLRPLVVTSDVRLESLPQTPILAEFVRGFSAPNWFGLFGPAGMDRKIVAQLNGVVLKLLSNPQFKEKLKLNGTLPGGGTSEALAERVQGDFNRYRGIVARSGLKL